MFSVCYTTGDEVKYQIELPDEIRDAAGNRYEPTGEWRRPKKGEWLLNIVGCAEKAAYDFEIHYYPILRPIWQWPDWLGGWGIASDIKGELYWYQKPARSVFNTWLSDSGPACSVDVIAAIHPSFVPPTITDWTQPVINPKWKGE